MRWTALAVDARARLGIWRVASQECALCGRRKKDKRVSGGGKARRARDWSYVERVLTCWTRVLQSVRRMIESFGNHPVGDGEWREASELYEAFRACEVTAVRVRSLPSRETYRHTYRHIKRRNVRVSGTAREQSAKSARRAQRRRAHLRPRRRLRVSPPRSHLLGRVPSRRERATFAQLVQRRQGRGGHPALAARQTARETFPLFFLLAR